MAELRGRNVLVLNWRDIRHPQAGGAELYAHEIARRWVAAGVRVTWLTSRPPGAAGRELIDGIQIIRHGRTEPLYARAAISMLRFGMLFDAVLDCQNGIPFFAPLFVPKSTAVTQVVHHVHQDQFGVHFGPAMASVGRFLEGPASRRIYRRISTIAVSPSTRRDVRARLQLPGPIFVVPNGNYPPASTVGPRDPDPTVVVVSRLVAHKRVELLLSLLPDVIVAVPRLRVEIVGDGPERRRLEQLVGELGLRRTVRFRGRMSNSDRDELLERAWLTTSTSQGEGWGCTVLEAAGLGVPCLAVAAPGINDSVLHSRTGWIVPQIESMSSAMVDALRELSDDEMKTEISASCRRWAENFTWDRTAELAAAVVVAEIECRAMRRGPTRRQARSDMTTAVSFRLPDHVAVPRARITDQLRIEGDFGSALLHGCDEIDAEAVLSRWDVEPISVELATETQLLTGLSVPVGEVTRAQ